MLEMDQLVKAAFYAIGFVIVAGVAMRWLMQLVFGK